MLAPEDAGGIVVELAEQRRKVARGLDERVLQSTVVSVPRVERPQTGSRVPFESADPHPGPVWANALPPGRAALVDRDRVSADLVLDSQLVVVLGGHCRRAVGRDERYRGIQYLGGQRHRFQPNATRREIVVQWRCAHPRREWRRGRTAIAKVVDASWIRSTGMVVVVTLLFGGLLVPKRAMEISCPRGSWRAL